MHSWMRGILVGLTLVLLVGLVAGGGLAQTKKLVIGASIVTTDNLWWVNCGKFIRETGEHLGTTVILTSAENDQAKQLKDVEDLIARGVDGLVIGPVHEEGSVAVLELAARHKVPVTLVGRRSRSDKYVAMYVYEEQMFGYWQATYIAARLAPKGGGNVVYLFGPVGAGYPRFQFEGFESVLKNHPQLKLLTVQRGPTDTVAEGMRLMEDALVRFPKIDAVAGNNDDLVLGAIGAAEAAGRAKDIIFTGSSGVPMGMQAIFDDRMHFTCLKSPALSASGAVTALVGHLRGEKIPVKDVFLQPVPVVKENVLKVRDPIFGGTVANPGTFVPEQRR